MLPRDLYLLIAVLILSLSACTTGTSTSSTDLGSPSKSPGAPAESIKVQTGIPTGTPIAESIFDGAAI